MMSYGLTGAGICSTRARRAAELTSGNWSTFRRMYSLKWHESPSVMLRMLNVEFGATSMFTMSPVATEPMLYENPDAQGWAMSRESASSTESAL